MWLLNYVRWGEFTPVFISVVAAQLSRLIYQRSIIFRIEARGARRERHLF